MSAFTDSISSRIDRIANPTVAAGLKVTPVPAAAVTMAKALLASRESTIARSSMVFMIEGGVMFDWSKPQVAVQIDRTRAILIDGRSGIEVGTTFSGIDVGFLAAFDAMFAGAVA